MVGGFVAVYIGVNWTFLPGAAHWIVGILMAMLAGGLWGLVPGLFKALFNVHEVISSIMMNYIGMYGVNLLIERTVYDQLKNQTVSVARHRCDSQGRPGPDFCELYRRLRGRFHREHRHLHRDPDGHCHLRAAL